MNRILIILLLSISGSAGAQVGVLYKCVDAKGVTSYQQTACEAKKKEAGSRAYVQEPDAPGLSWSGAAAQKRAEAARRSRTTTPVATAPRAVPSTSASAEQQRRMEHLAGSREGRQTLRAMSGQKPPAAPAQPTAPVTRTDQYGNTYTQPPGSTIVTDDKTGRQCFVNGQTVECH